MDRWMVVASLFTAFFAFNPQKLTNLMKPRTAQVVRTLDSIEYPMPSKDSSSQYVHLVVLVHGIYGNPSELSYLKTALDFQSRSRPQEFLVHSAESNLDRTTDGIASGGGRLAQEVNAWIEQIDTDKHVTLSFVGNSLGGLYARYALPGIHWERHNNDNSNKRTPITPAVFCTTATPHLGVAAPHTYLKIGKVGELAAAKFMGKTGMDLFRKSSVLQDMTVYPTFMDPLKAFRHRLALANAYNTDFQVPCSTAAFLSKTDSLHRHIEKPEPLDTGSFVALRVETTTSSNDGFNDTLTTEEVLSSDTLATRLDHLGWTKVFCDVRKSLVAAPVPFVEKSPYELPETSDTYTSRQLWDAYATFFSDNRWHLPVGHTMMVVNSKTEFQARMNSGGQPIMDKLAKEIMDEIEDAESQALQ